MKNNELLGLSAEGFHRIAYTEWGNPNSTLPAVICVHGYSRNGRDFDALASYLSAKGRHVFCPDVVGRGESAWFKSPQHYNFTQYLADMNALIARTQSKQIDWIGTSMGGIIGMMIAAQPNSPIRQLILNDVGPQIPVHGLKKLNIAGRENEFKSLDAAKAYFKKQYSEFDIANEEQWDALTEHSLRQREADLYVMKMDPNVKNAKTTTQFISELFQHPSKTLEGILYDIDLWSFWKKLHCPVLAIRGKHSDLLTAEIVKKMKRLHKETQLYEKENAGHAPALLCLVDHETINSWLDSKP